jgi:hypothetical protein
MNEITSALSLSKLARPRQSVFSRGRSDTVSELADLPKLDARAFFDYAYSMTYGWGHGAAPAVAGVVERYPVQAPADLMAVADTVQAIEAMEAEAIRSIATRLSPNFIEAGRAMIIADGLLRRRTELREALRREYGGGL